MFFCMGADSILDFAHYEVSVMITELCYCVEAASDNREVSVRDGRVPRRRDEGCRAQHRGELGPGV